MRFQNLLLVSALALAIMPLHTDATGQAELIRSKQSSPAELLE